MTPDWVTVCEQDGDTPAVRRAKVEDGWLYQLGRGSEAGVIWDVPYFVVETETEN